MTELVDLSLYRTMRRRDAAPNLALLRKALLYGPITEEIANALEFMTDEEVAAFFHARAKAQLMRLTNKD